MLIHHTAISTPNLARLASFYREVFGFEIVHEFGWPSGVGAVNAVLGLPDSAAKAAMLRRGDSMLELFEFSRPAPQPQGERRPVCDHGFTHVCFQVDDVAKEQARCEERGMRFHSAPMSSGPLTFSYGRDPDGNVVELLSVQGDAHPMAVRGR
jgi:catechol 2,3-dioxygenase-like lactoylglutathione lyase family enzyme